uniref:Retrovirus-related Pol polyprotein from transposon TNT 1-94 n=1 Tax=Tanacetum cinerariifolium TaxID=118510 RepID=A0A6L2NV63_TANCI|nr:retrovirus-related Pol polyprotein from transposon TNT 1-94 [Tanacetum cinerariifolium]
MARSKVNTAAIRPNVNAKSAYFKPHFPKRRHFNQRLAAKTNTFSRKINTAKGKNVTTAGLKAVVNAAEGKKENVVESSACWIWRPKGNLIDHTSKDSGSYTLKRFNYVDQNGRLKHMTGNKSFLTEYQEIDGGFIAFEGSPKGGIENQLNHRFKIIKCDNKTEFKNSKMNQFCQMKGIKREFSVAMTQQQNGVAERKNSILIKVARTMLANFLLPTTFWAEAVNTACYVQNKVLVTKPHNKTPYELLIGRSPNLEFMRPFGCPVTILNTLDHLGKFDGKADEGFLVRYSVNSKAFRVFNSRTRKVKENLHEMLMLVTYKVMLMRYHEMMMYVKEMKLELIAASCSTGIFDGAFDDRDLGAKADTNNLDSSIVVSPIPITRVHKDHPKEQIIGDPNLNTQTRRMINFSKETTMALKDSSWIEAIQEELLQFKLQDVWNLVDLPYGKRAIGSKWVFKNKLDERGIVIRNKTRLVAQGHTQEKGIDYDEVFAPVAKIEAIRHFMAFASFKDFIVYQMDVKSTFLYGKIEEEVYVCQPPGFEDPDFPDKVYKVKKALYGLHQAPKACQDKYVAEILKKFGFSEVKTARTTMETSKPLLKDEDGQEYKKQTIVVNSITKAEYVVASSCCRQKKQKPSRKQRNEVEISNDESKDEDHVPTPSSDPLPSDDDRSILNELMVFYTSLQEQSRSGGLRRLKKIGSGRKVKSPMEKDGLVDDLSGEEVVMETTTSVKDSTAPTTNVTEDDVTMAQSLAALKSTKPKVVVQEQEMSTTIPAAATIVKTAVPTPRAKGKANMIEPEVPIKSKERMRIDEEYVRKLEAEEQEAARLSRAQQDEKANKSWDNMQAMMDDDRLLAKKLQARERKNSLRCKRQDCGYKQSHLKGRSFDEIKKLFDREMTKLRKCIEIVPDDGDEVLIRATPISSRSPTIIDYKIHKEGKKTYFKIIRADVKDIFKKEKPMDDMVNILFRTLNTMFEHHDKDTIWKYQQGLAKVKN